MVKTARLISIANQYVTEKYNIDKDKLERSVNSASSNAGININIHVLPSWMVAKAM